MGMVTASPAVAAKVAPPGAKLVISPQSLIFQVGTPPAVAVAEVTVQVISPGQQPWRLTVMALGDLQSEEGTRIPVNQVTWRGRPGAVFVDGALSANHPQLLARGQSSKAGVVRFFLKNRWEHAEGRYSQRLIFNLSSP
ncbi:MAG: hypothetical protein FJ134_00520 [Deltaproteobacteria bacterium]|nr:hypothetical protein [Deltaproteobacteria bacterium]